MMSACYIDRKMWWQLRRDESLGHQPYLDSYPSPIFIRSIA